jgi:hypothetical protein
MWGLGREQQRMSKTAASGKRSEDDESVQEINLKRVLRTESKDWLSSKIRSSH